MKVLVLGAGGFIGSHVAAALHQQGYQVVRGLSPRASAEAAAGTAPISVDFAQDVDAQTWLPRLHGIDAVVNAVGILRGTRARPMEAVHVQTPAAIFEACRQAGVRVVHISALGVAEGDSEYARTKRQAEGRLHDLVATGQLAATVVRPSVVFGRGGGSDLFVTIARFPVAVLPAVAWRARVQPIHVKELAESIVGVLELPAGSAPLVLEAVGPEATSLADFVASLRAQQGHGRARMFKLSDGLTALSASLADWVPVSPWGKQALSLLGSDNVADSAAITALLGRAPTHYSALLAHAQTAAANQ